MENGFFRVLISRPPSLLSPIPLSHPFHILTSMVLLIPHLYCIPLKPNIQLRNINLKHFTDRKCRSKCDVTGENSNK
jgi:hypothetical protein